MKASTAIKLTKMLREATLYIGAVLIIAAFAVACTINGKTFLSWTNITNIIVQASIIAIIAIGTSMVIITGGIDLSSGAIVGFVGIVSGMLIKAGLPIPVSCLLGILVAAVFGLINGLGISYGKLPPFIMTLGIMMIAQGGTLALSEGKPVSNFPLELGDIANSSILGIPVFIFYVIILYALAIFTMNKTRFGRYLYAIGGNVKAARLSGVKDRFIQTLSYVIAGIFSGVAGILLLSRLSYASTTGGSGYEMDAIASAVIGGISLSGGQGKIQNTLLGALILTILKNGLQMLDVSTYFQKVLIGIVIIVAIFFDKAEERKAE